MIKWTTKQYLIYRKANNWPELSNVEVDSIVSQLNDIQELMPLLDGMETIEPKTDLDMG